MNILTAGTNFNIFYILVFNAPNELQNKLKLKNTKFAVGILCLHSSVFMFQILFIIISNVRSFHREAI